MKFARPGVALLAILVLAACGRGGENKDQPSADERRKLDEAAAKLDAESETVDTSPDSLVPADSAATGSNAAAADGTAPNAAAPAAPANNSAANTAAPR
jgi:uncharacterized lipoprotein